MRTGLLAFVVAACAQESPPSDANGSTGADQALAHEEIVRDVTDVEAKLIALAEALSEEQYAWRPGEGVRSSGQVLMHIASVNYAFPILTGTEAPEGVAMSLDDFFPSIAAYEQVAQSKEDILPVLRSSLDHLRDAVEASSSDLDRELDVFGTPTSVRGFWWMHMGHLHEHLGQLIAYARSNGVAPPWS